MNSRAFGSCLFELSTLLRYAGQSAADLFMLDLVRQRPQEARALLRYVQAHAAEWHRFLDAQQNPESKPKEAVVETTEPPAVLRLEKKVEIPEKTAPPPSQAVVVKKPATDYPAVSIKTLAEILPWAAQQRMLVCATQYPGYGGSATNAYNICRYLRDFGQVPTACLFLEALDFASPDKYDPENIGGVFRCPRWSKITRFDKAKFPLVHTQFRRDAKRFRDSIRKFLGGEPTLIICKNYVSPNEITTLYPKVPKVYFVSGSKHLTLLNHTFADVKDAHTVAELAAMVPEEVKANQASDWILPNSVLSRDVFSHIYPEVKPRMVPVIDTSLCSMALEEKSRQSKASPVKAWSQRKYDLIYVVSSCQRGIKGPDMAVRIFGHPRLRHLKKLVVGDYSDQVFASVQDNLECKPTLPNSQVLKDVMAHAKVIAMPSLFDASPNTVREAVACGVRPVISPNIGNSECYHADYVVQSYGNLEEWVDKILAVWQAGDAGPPTLLGGEKDMASFLPQFLSTLRYCTDTPTPEISFSAQEHSPP